MATRPSATGVDWRAFRAIDDSVATLLRQLVRAVVGMFLAYVAARWVSDQVLRIPSDEVLLHAVVFAGFGSAAIFVTSARPIRQAIAGQRAAIEAHERVLRAESERHRFTASLQEAFELAETEGDTHEVIRRAVTHVIDADGEVLVADSSRAHLRRVAVIGDEAPGCDVATPWACPAVRRSQVLTYTDSEALEACPRLRDRPRGRISATCIPMTVLGSPTGVLHVVGEPGEVPDDEEVEALEGIAAAAGGRIGLLRALTTAQLQATTDPLTGLHNRRSLEAELRRLRERQIPYALVVADLDHFKDLNDAHGHNVGDRALRLFADVVKRSVRDADLACRYGGEEIVLLLPNCSRVDGAVTVERVRAALREALDSGDVPNFTASYGLADSTLDDHDTEVFRLADNAMFRAKQQGRDRLVVVDEADGDGAPARPSGPSVITADRDEVGSATVAELRDHRAG